MKTVYIKDYVSLPCDDATKGIMKAIEDAKQTCAQCIEFEAGVYKLKQSYKHKTDHTMQAQILKSLRMFTYYLAN